MKEEISYREFMAGLDSTQKYYTKVVQTAVRNLQQISSMREQVYRNLQYGYRVKYFLEDGNNYLYEAEERGPIGFPGVMDGNNPEDRIILNNGKPN